MDSYENPFSSPHQPGYDYLSLIEAGSGEVEEGTFIQHLLYARPCNGELHVFSPLILTACLFNMVSDEQNRGLSWKRRSDPSPNGLLFLNFSPCFIKGA